MDQTIGPSIEREMILDIIDDYMDVVDAVVSNKDKEDEDTRDKHRHK